MKKRILVFVFLLFYLEVFVCLGCTKSFFKFIAFNPTTARISNISPITNPNNPMLNKLKRAIDIVFNTTPVVVALNVSFVLPKACNVLDRGPSKL